MDDEITGGWLESIGFSYNSACQNYSIGVFGVKTPYPDHEARVFMFGSPIPNKKPWTRASLVTFFQTLGYINE